MKKSILYIMMGLLLPLTVNASHIRARISSEAKQKIRVVIDGHLVNRKPYYEVNVDYLKPGRHHVKVEVFGRHGRRVVRDKIYLKNGFDNRFVVTHRHGSLGIFRTHIQPIRHNMQPYHSRPVRKPLLKQHELEELKYNLELARFDGDKLAIIKDAIRYRRVYSEDVLDFMGYFIYESTKLKLTKFAYHKVQDKENYFLVMDGFRFHSSSRELERYLYQFPM